MPNETLNFNLKKPTPSEFYDVQVSNENMDKIDSALKELDDKTDDLETSSGGIQQQVNNNTNAIQTLEQTLSEHQAHYAQLVQQVKDQEMLNLMGGL